LVSNAIRTSAYKIAMRFSAWRKGKFLNPILIADPGDTGHGRMAADGTHINEHNPAFRRKTRRNIAFLAAPDAPAGRADHRLPGL
jgi:hypothetical protein